MEGLLHIHSQIALSVSTYSANWEHMHGLHYSYIAHLLG